MRVDFPTPELPEKRVTFPEIFEASVGCRYNNCTHTHEPGCAVKKALEEHTISESRYASYLSIIEDASPDKYRKPF